MKFYPCSVIGNILFFSFFQKSNALLSDSLSRLSFRRYIFLNALLPENYQDVGNELIYEAGKGCGTSEDQLSVVWKGGKVTVTVAGDAFLSVPDDESNSHESGVDVVVLARAINAALDENEIGTRIAETHEIEVTTPGASDELTGVMWDVYRGFDVVAKFIDPKKQVEKTIEGRLHERTEDITIINIKGRMKKIKNGNLLSVMLPKAKTEKGSK